MAEQQKIEGKNAKYARGQREELAAERKRQAGGGGPPGPAGKPDKKSWKKTKGGEDGSRAPRPPCETRFRLHVKACVT